mmetsp:Transcript_135691/g.249559  ORF Transcript_135691/g.249559 Transcript_135691/m.249559 type:complete len:300 (+) Transcript_135691:229-1128(+)
MRLQWPWDCLESFSAGTRKRQRVRRGCQRLVPVPPIPIEIGPPMQSELQRRTLPPGPALRKRSIRQQQLCCSRQPRAPSQHLPPRPWNQPQGLEPAPLSPQQVLRPCRPETLQRGPVQQPRLSEPQQQLPHLHQQQLSQQGLPPRHLPPQLPPLLLRMLRPLQPPLPCLPQPLLPWLLQRRLCRPRQLLPEYLRQQWQRFLQQHRWLPHLQQPLPPQQYRQTQTTLACLPLQPLLRPHQPPCLHPPLAVQWLPAHFQHSSAEVLPPLPRTQELRSLARQHLLHFPQLQPVIQWKQSLLL